MNDEVKNVISFKRLAEKQEDGELGFLTEDEMSLYDVNDKKMKRLEAIDQCLADLILDPDAPEIKPVDDGFVRGTGNALLCVEIPLPFEFPSLGVKETVQKILRLADYVYVADNPDDSAIDIFISVFEVLKRKEN